MTNLNNFIEIGKLKSAQDIKGKVKEFITDQQLLELADNFEIPHYIVKNPITGQKGTYFLQDEVQQWFVENCISRNTIKVEQTLQIFNFSSSGEVRRAGEDIPPSLSDIKNLYRLPLENLSTPPGIYFLCQDMEIVYIGQSIDVAYRVVTHLSEATKVFNRVFFIPCHRSNLLAFEKKLIIHFKPKYNSEGFKNNECIGELNVIFSQETEIDDVTSY
jgi:hypothetical protein